MTMLTRMGLVAAVSAAMWAAPALADQGGVPHNGGGEGNDHAAQPATPAQPGDGAKPATPAHPSQKSDDQDRGKGHGKSHGKGKGHRKSHGQEATGKTTAPQSPHAKAGKTTICHATGSAKNPYVEITVSNNAVPAHSRHQDGRDIVPAPAGGCPGPAAQEAPQSTTDSTSSTTTQTAASTRSTVDTAALLSTTAQSLTGTKPESHVLGERITRSATRSRAATRSANRSAGARSALRTLPADASSSGSTLPFTGLDLGIVAAIGAAMLLAGFALNRARRISRTRP